MDRHALVDGARQCRRPAQLFRAAPLVAPAAAMASDAGQVQLALGVTLELLAVDAVGREAGDAGRGRRALAERVPQPSRDRRAVVAAGARRDDREAQLLDPPDRVHRAHGVAHHLAAPTRAARRRCPAGRRASGVPRSSITTPSGRPVRAARLSSASRRSSKPRRFRQPVSGSARDTRASASRRRSCVARLPDAHGRRPRPARTRSATAAPRPRRCPAARPRGRRDSRRPPPRRPTAAGRTGRRTPPGRKNMNTSGLSGAAVDRHDRARSGRW